jgi:hypothetical protein
LYGSAKIKIFPFFGKIFFLFPGEQKMLGGGAAGEGEYFLLLSGDNFFNKLFFSRNINLLYKQKRKDVKDLQGAEG